MRPVKRFVNRSIVGSVVKQLTTREAVGMGFQDLLIHVEPEAEGRLRVTLDPQNLFTRFPEHWTTYLKMPYELTHEVAGSPIMFGVDGDYGVHPIRTPFHGGKPVWASWCFNLPAVASAPALPTTTFTAEFCIPKGASKAAEFALFSAVGDWPAFDYSSWGMKMILNAGTACCVSVLGIGQGEPGEGQQPRVHYTEGSRHAIELDTWYRVEFHASACSLYAKGSSTALATDTWPAEQQNKAGIPKGASHQFQMNSTGGKFLFRGLWVE